jgi:hypothetical protein
VVFLRRETNIHYEKLWNLCDVSGALVVCVRVGACTDIHHAEQFTSTDGNLPAGGLVQAADGNFYGTTAAGRVNGCKVDRGHFNLQSFDLAVTSLPWRPANAAPVDDC